MKNLYHFCAYHQTLLYIFTSFCGIYRAILLEEKTVVCLALMIVVPIQAAVAVIIVMEKEASADNPLQATWYRRQLLKLPAPV